ncbi:hypothetical protein LTR62_007627 [Meristemomyces frigidus]|uniref:Uncharacterized protein n=1 Tax=Meristemomyces frigidus TaxID=1508187 RepID=A0AAN7YDI4_9PEZI|nr:hypothetical protein LTR62_007627 [Meristemomyces frigidus]
MATAPTTLQHPPGTNQNPSTLSKARDSIKFLVDPKTGPQPHHLRTRALLRSLRYFTIFAFWRLIRYAKYALVGAAVAAISGTAIGSVVSGTAFLIAPTGVLGGAGVGVLWAIGKFGWRRARARYEGGRAREGRGDARADERDDAREGEGKGDVVIKAPRADPW